MIERNLGNAERVIRLAVGLIFGGWVLSQPALHSGEWALIVLFIALVLNGIFSRCYLWYLLDVNTARQRGATPARSGCEVAG